MAKKLTKDQERKILELFEDDYTVNEVYEFTGIEKKLILDFSTRLTKITINKIVRSAQTLKSK